MKADRLLSELLLLQAHGRLTGREMAERLEVSSSCLLYWIERGVVRARKEHGGWQRGIVWADAAELERLRAYRHRDIAAERRHRWTAPHNGNDCQNGSTP